MPGAFYGIVVSHGLFVLCGATYFVYWALQELAPGPAAVGMFLLSLLLGFGGAIGAFASVIAGASEGAEGRLKLGRIVAACGALLVAAYVATSVLLDRPFTSELVFVMIWACAEMCALHVAHVRGWLVGGRALAALGAASLALATGLACYAIYFELEGRARFAAGLVPYAAVSLAMLVAGLLVLRGRRCPPPAN
jgi:hypothetical protein